MGVYDDAVKALGQFTTTPQKSIENKMMSPKDPYLQEILESLTKRRERTMKHGVSPEGLAARHLITTSSIRASALPVSTVHAKLEQLGLDTSDFQFPPEYTFVNKNGVVSIRPEEVMAYFFTTPKGKTVSEFMRGGGIATPEVMREASLVSRVFGRHSIAPALESQSGRTVADAHNVAPVISNKAQSGDLTGLRDEVQGLGGVGAGKSPFVEQMLGFGHRATADARELTAHYPVREERVKAEGFLKNRASANAVQEHIQSLMDPIWPNEGLPPEQAGHIKHVALWGSEGGLPPVAGLDTALNVVDYGGMTPEMYAQWRRHVGGGTTSDFHKHIGDFLHQDTGAPIAPSDVNVDALMKEPIDRRTVTKGDVYLVNQGKKIAPGGLRVNNAVEFRVEGLNPNGLGWVGINLKTGRPLVVKTAQRLLKRKSVSPQAQAERMNALRSQSPQTSTKSPIDLEALQSHRDELVRQFNQTMDGVDLTDVNHPEEALQRIPRWASDKLTPVVQAIARMDKFLKPSTQKAKTPSGYTREGFDNLGTEYSRSLQDENEAFEQGDHYDILSHRAKQRRIESVWDSFDAHDRPKLNPDTQMSVMGESLNDPNLDPNIRRQVIDQTIGGKVKRPTGAYDNPEDEAYQAKRAQESMAAEKLSRDSERYRQNYMWELDKMPMPKGTPGEFGIAGKNTHTGEKVTIPTKGVDFGDFFLWKDTDNPRKTMYSVTHKSTGMRAANFEREALAKKFIKGAIHSGYDYSPSTVDEINQKNPQALKDLHDVKNAILGVRRTHPDNPGAVVMAVPSYYEKKEAEREADRAEQKKVSGSTSTDRSTKPDETNPEVEEVLRLLDRHMPTEERVTPRTERTPWGNPAVAGSDKPSAYSSPTQHDVKPKKSGLQLPEMPSRGPGPMQRARQEIFDQIKAFGEANDVNLEQSAVPLLDTMSVDEVQKFTKLAATDPMKALHEHNLLPLFYQYSDSKPVVTAKAPTAPPPATKPEPLDPRILRNIVRGEIVDAYDRQRKTIDPDVVNAALREMTPDQLEELQAAGELHRDYAKAYDEHLTKTQAPHTHSVAPEQAFQGYDTPLAPVEAAASVAEAVPTPPAQKQEPITPAPEVESRKATPVERPVNPAHTLEAAMRRLMGKAQNSWGTTYTHMSPTSMTEGIEMLNEGWPVEHISRAKNILGGWGHFLDAGLATKPPWEITDDDIAKLNELAPWDKISKATRRRGRTAAAMNAAANGVETNAPMMQDGKKASTPKTYDGFKPKPASRPEPVSELPYTPSYMDNYDQTPLESPRQAEVPVTKNEPLVPPLRVRKSNPPREGTPTMPGPDNNGSYLDHILEMMNLRSQNQLASPQAPEPLGIRKVAPPGTPPPPPRNPLDNVFRRPEIGPDVPVREWGSKQDWLDPIDMDPKVDTFSRPIGLNERGARFADPMMGPQASTGAPRLRPPDMPSMPDVLAAMKQAGYGVSDTASTPYPPTDPSKAMAVWEDPPLLKNPFTPKRDIFPRQAPQSPEDWLANSTGTGRNAKIREGLAIPNSGTPLNALDRGPDMAGRGGMRQQAINMFRHLLGGEGSTTSPSFNAESMFERYKPGAAEPTWEPTRLGRVASGSLGSAGVGAGLAAMPEVLQRMVDAAEGKSSLADSGFWGNVAKDAAIGGGIGAALHKAPGLVSPLVGMDIGSGTEGFAKEMGWVPKVDDSYTLPGWVPGVGGSKVDNLIGKGVGTGLGAAALWAGLGPEMLAAGTGKMVGDIAKPLTDLAVDPAMNWMGVGKYNPNPGDLSQSQLDFQTNQPHGGHSRAAIHAALIGAFNQSGGKFENMDSSIHALRSAGYDMPTIKNMLTQAYRDAHLASGHNNLTPYDLNMNRPEVDSIGSKYAVPPGW